MTCYHPSFDWNRHLLEAGQLSKFRFYFNIRQEENHNILMRPKIDFRRLFSFSYIRLSTYLISFEENNFGTIKLEVFNEDQEEIFKKDYNDIYEVIDKLSKLTASTSLRNYTLSYKLI
jgi:hypothetical protein